eukprot:CAMPEP_0194037130 /NCGR_PEP_ID=MMETSP0009_2-20130614/9469_1 /TAXON_ID=210454 /ORGANISM="Grammatophora oceanica, Strain CCMP 410" /LENGTH=33 /DNA_ID= /DNA_START= /DNA_END= /DNA_ORIENTATION=
MTVRGFCPESSVEPRLKAGVAQWNQILLTSWSA